MIKNRDICLEKQPFEETNFVKFRFSLHSDDLNCMELYGYMDIYLYGYMDNFVTFIKYWRILMICITKQTFPSAVTQNRVCSPPIT